MSIEISKCSHCDSDLVVLNKDSNKLECPNCIEKFECGDCGCYFWVKDRSNFDCPNCESYDDEKQENNRG